MFIEIMSKTYRVRFYFDLKFGYSVLKYIGIQSSPQKDLVLFSFLYGCEPFNIHCAPVSRVVSNIFPSEM